MNRLKFLVSLLLALGLVACPDDEDEKDDAKYSLKVAKPSGAKVGTAFSVEVKLYKGDALVTGDDAKGAEDADVSGSIKCVEHSAEVGLTKVKLSDTGKASFSVTIEENSDKTTTAIGTKGYTDCVVSASTEFGDDKTKASGDSGKFAVAAKTSAEEPPADELTVEVDASGLVEIENPDAQKKITLVKSGQPACAAKLITWSDEHVVADVPSGGIASNTDLDVFVVGVATGCKIVVGQAEDDLGDYDQPNKVTVTLNVNDTIGYTLASGHGLTNKIIFVLKKASGTPIVKEVADATNIGANAQTITGVTELEAVAYTVWIRHSAGIEEKAVTATNQ